MFALNGSIRCFLYLTCGESPLQDALLLIVLQGAGMDRQISAVLHIVNGQVGQSGMEHVQVADVLPDVLGQLIDQFIGQIAAAAEIGALCDGGNVLGLGLIGVGRDGCAEPDGDAVFAGARRPCRWSLGTGASDRPSQHWSAPGSWRKATGSRQ